MSYRKPIVTVTCLECGATSRPGHPEDVFEGGNYCKNPDCSPEKGEDGMTEKSRQHARKFK